MKLNKTVLAVAVAGIAATPMTSFATTSVSGTVQIQLSGNDDDETQVPNLNGELDDAGDARITIGDVLLGFTGSQALNIGLTGYGSYRLDAGFSGADVTSDNVYVGIRGGFGDVRFGEVPNAGEFGQFSDILNDAGTGVDQGVSYTGSFSGFTVGATYSPTTNHDLFAFGARFGFAGFSVAAGVQNQDELNNVTGSVGFAFAGASVNVGVASLEEAAPDGDDLTVFRANVGYSIAGVSLGLTYESEDEAERDAIRFDASYDLGGGMDISTRINALSDDADDANSSDDWRIQLSKSF